MRKILMYVFCLFLPLGVFAETSTTDTDVIITQMKAILDQYGARLKALETENTILRNEMMKAGIKIPLSAFTGIVILNGPQTSSGLSTSSSGVMMTSSGNTTLLSSSRLSDSQFADIAQKYSEQYASFVRKIRTDWGSIISAYKMPSTAYIGGYEFIAKGDNNHVFVDIVYSGSLAAGIYDAKLLYQYHTGTYQRKLIGFFEFNKATGYYITRTGTNPFIGVTRISFADPLQYQGISNVPAVSPQVTTNSVSASSGTISLSATPTLADIEKAYSDKRYLTTISLSTAYLQVNSPTVDILRIRYRTFFIIGKYGESLEEIGKIESIGKLEKAIACDAQVIATYSKTQTLVDKYTKICKG